MKVTIDISMYPNKENFIPPIKGFIEKINTYDSIKVATFPRRRATQGRR